jgi:hypothetical protein
MERSRRLGQQISMSHLPKHIIPRPLYNPARPPDFTYCSALTKKTLIVMTIFGSLGLCPVVTPHRVNIAAHLPIQDQFTF